MAGIIRGYTEPSRLKVDSGDQRSGFGEIFSKILRLGRDKIPPRQMPVQANLRGKTDVRYGVQWTAGKIAAGSGRIWGGIKHAADATVNWTRGKMKDQPFEAGLILGLTSPVTVPIIAVVGPAVAAYRAGKWLGEKVGGRSQRPETNLADGGQVHVGDQFSEDEDYATIPVHANEQQSPAPLEREKGILGPQMGKNVLPIGLESLPLPPEIPAPLPPPPKTSAPIPPQPDGSAPVPGLSDYHVKSMPLPAKQQQPKPASPPGEPYHSVPIPRLVPPKEGQQQTNSKPKELRYHSVPFRPSVTTSKRRQQSPTSATAKPGSIPASQSHYHRISTPSRPITMPPPVRQHPGYDAVPSPRPTSAPEDETYATIDFPESLPKEESIYDSTELSELKPGQTGDLETARIFNVC